MRAPQIGVPLGVLAIIAAAFPLDSAAACRGVRNWPTGAETEPLAPDTIVVRARMIEAYKAEKPIPSIMGHPNGMIYFVTIEDARPSASQEAKDMIGTRLFIRLRPSICEAYYPDDFGPAKIKTLVLKKDEGGLWSIIGGEGPK